ncbi:hypothetical protein KQH62_02890 [bacterium]|nr:hypothetical protein [bacterium]
MKLRMTIFVRVLITVFLGGLVLAACSGREVGEATSTEPPERADAPTQFPAYQTMIAEAVRSKTATVAPTESMAAEAPAIQQHLTQPGEPVYSVSLPSECNTGYAFELPDYEVRPPCDNWEINLLERAVSADLTTMYHYVDILAAQVGMRDGWYYLGLDVFGAGLPEDGETLTYYFELDPNQDGRGDILLTVQKLDLFTTQWTVGGVRAYRDLNDDVGGETAVRPDDGPGNGYETVIFDEGYGSDPDLVWARRDPVRTQRIEFAFKESVLAGEESFMWWGGAVLGPFDPRSFDFGDTKDSETLFKIDTTCGWAFGVDLAYNARRCFIAPEPTEVIDCVQPPPPNDDPCWIWNEGECAWVCFN